jgi:hypothetical protein
MNYKLYINNAELTAVNLYFVIQIQMEFSKLRGALLSSRFNLIINIYIRKKGSFNE